MGEATKTIVEKISSYNIFTNLFPGTVFCYIVNKITRFSISSDNLIEQLFIWYFVGMIISRIGSIFIERVLKKIKIKGNPYIKFANYKQYCAASEAKPSIAILSEVNNTYRTMISLLLALVIIYCYDRFIFDWITSLISGWDEIICISLSFILILLFVKSYKKQTDYVRKQVEKYVNDTSSTKQKGERCDH